MKLDGIAPTRIARQTRRLAGQVTDQAESLVSATRDRWDERENLANDLRERYDDSLRPKFQTTGVRLLQVAQAVLAVAVAVPRLVARSVGIARVLTERAEDLSDRGHQIAERAREVAHTIPPSAHDRHVRRWRTFGWISLGFAGGFAVGWIVGDARGLAAQERDAEQAERHARIVALNDANQRSHAGPHETTLRSADVLDAADLDDGDDPRVSHPGA